MAIPTLIKQLSDNGYTVKHDKLAELTAQSDAHVAWYQHVLLAIGVFAAFVCFLLLLFATEFYYLGNIGQSVFAVIFIAVAIGWYRSLFSKPSKEATLSAVLVIQITFVLLVAGKVLLFYNVCELLDITQLWQAALVAMVITAVTFVLYPVLLSRIVSLAFTSFLTLTAVPMASTPLFVFVVLGLVYVSFSPRGTWQALRYAFTITIFLVVTFSPSEFGRVIDNFTHTHSYSGIFVFYPSFIIATVLCACVLYLAGQQRRFYGVQLLCVALLGLAYFLPATLFFALLVMVLGYATHDKVMTGLGLALMPYYLFRYYYDLQWSLLDKSLLLMASGGILLVVALVVAKLPKAPSAEEQ